MSKFVDVSQCGATYRFLPLVNTFRDCTRQNIHHGECAHM